jgi:hypothetical protein
MLSFSARLAPLALIGVVLTACGGSGSSAAPAGGEGTPAVESGSAGATASARPPSGAASAAASPTASNASGVAVGAGSASPASEPSAGSPAPAAGAERAPLPPPGTYSYRLSGSSTSALGTQDLDGESTLTVDQPQGNREHSTQRDKGGSTEQVVVSRSDGLYLAEIHLAQPGFDEDFKPAHAVLLFPLPAHRGQQWRWHMTSTDGKYTLAARLTVDDLHSSARTVSGERVDTVALSSVLHLKSDDIDLTIHQHDEAGQDALIVREHAVTDGTAYGTKFHSDATRVLQNQP